MKGERTLCVTVVTVLFAFLLTVNVRSDNDSNVISNCFIRDYSNIRCTGDFNLSNILLKQRELSDASDSFWPKSIRGLEIFNSTIERIDEKFLQFHGFEIETILIENVPRLRYIHPEAFVQLKDHLTDSRAINTSLPNYNDYGNDPHKSENPFDDFTQLREVYIGEPSHCPSDENLIFPCKCEFGELYRSVPSGLWGWSSGLLNVFGTTTNIICENENLTGDMLKALFTNISRSDHTPKHFDVLTIRGTSNFTKIPSDVFSNISITTIWMEDVNNLKSIHQNAFGSESNARVARSIQILDINNANFTSANSSEVDDIFRAFSSLTNIRVLRLGKCGIPYMPPYAFAPQNPQKQLNNLRYLTLSFDRRKHPSGIRSVGSYAFSGAPNLVELGLIRNYIKEFDSYAFAFNKTSDRPLTIHIGGNPFNDTYGLKPNAFSGSQRPVRIKFEIDSFKASDVANDPSLHIIPEDVFRPFIEENPDNFFEVDYFNVEIWCDCKSKWMFDDIGNLKQSVQNGLRIKRVENGLVGSVPLSIQCKAESSFECLPNCLVFSLAGLIHCGGNNNFDITSTFRKLALLNGTKSFDKLVFSSKELEELPMNAFATFQFTNIDLTGCWNLSRIHPNAFGASTETVKNFAAKNTNLTYYPNFATFPNLEIIQLDDYSPFRINSTNFDFSQASTNPKEILVLMNNGSIDPNTFTKLNNETTVNLNIGEANDCSTIACLIKCKPIRFNFDENTFKAFLEANANNKIHTNCYLECSCELQWMYEMWKNAEENIGSRVAIWLKEYFGDKFYCVPEGANLETTENFFGIDISKFNYGTYFKENCSG